jgi:TonB family protein
MTPLGPGTHELGDVQGTGGIARATPAVTLPLVAATQPASTTGRGAAELGSAVRTRTPQLESCYETRGLTRNPTLAGVVTVAMTIAATGQVTSVDVVRRTWAGPGAAEVEACLRAAVRTWRFPPVDEATTTYEVLVSFTGR